MRPSGKAGRILSVNEQHQSVAQTWNRGPCEYWLCALASWAMGALWRCTPWHSFPLRNSDTPCARITAAPDVSPPAVVPRGLEPRTLRLLAVRSDQLSYETCVKGRQPKSNLPVLHWPGISLDSICISLARLSDPHGPMQNTVQHPSTVVTPAHHEDGWSHAGLNRGPYGY